MSSMLRQDFYANKGNTKGKFVLFLFRFASLFASRKGSIIWFFGLPVMVFYRITVEWILGIELPAKTKVSPGLAIYHGQGLVINDGVVIGKNVTLRHCTTIGNIIYKDGSISACPIIGDNVEVGANVVIIGPVRVGNNSRIGAGTVVIKDVPDNTTAIGNPARLIQHSTAEQHLEARYNV